MMRSNSRERQWRRLPNICKWQRRTRILKIVEEDCSDMGGSLYITCFLRLFIASLDGQALHASSPLCDWLQVFYVNWIKVRGCCIQENNERNEVQEQDVCNPLKTDRESLLTEAGWQNISFLEKKNHESQKKKKTFYVPSFLFCLPREPRHPGGVFV